MTEDAAAFEVLTRIWETSVRQNTNELNARVREDTIKTNLLIAQLNHKHATQIQENQIKAQEQQAQLNQSFQLKMLKLQEHFKLQEKWFDVESRRAFMYEQAVVQAHSKKMDQCGEYYTIGNYLQEKLRNQPAPYIIISTNALGIMNPLKGEGLINVPLNNITDTLRKFNGVYEVKKLLTIIDTNEYFTSESDIAGFYHRELNCPCIIVYATFTTDSVVVSGYLAGMLDEQRENASFDEEMIDLRPRRQVFYSIPYGNIYSMMQNAKTAGKPFEWQLRLSEFTTDLVVLWIQRYLDEYFKYLPINVYESKTDAFINSRGEILKKQFPDLISDFDQKLKALNNFQKSNKLSTGKGGFLPLNSFLYSRIENENLKRYLHTFTSFEKGFTENLLPVYNPSRTKMGYIDIDGILRIEYQYWLAQKMNNSKAIVYINEKKQQIIDNNGKELSPYEFDAILFLTDDSIIITCGREYNNMQVLRIYDQHLNYVSGRVDINAEEAYYYWAALRLLSNEFLEMRLDVKGSDVNPLLEKANKILEDYSYSKYSFYPFEGLDYMALDYYHDFNKKRRRNNVIQSKNVEPDLFKFSRNGLWGFKDSRGKVIFDAVFSHVNDFADDRCLVKFKGFAEDEWAIIDTEGNILTKAQK